MRKFSKLKSNFSSNPENSFKLLQSSKFPDFGINLQKYEHGSLKTVHNHLSCQDPQNTLCFTFRNSPSNNSGLAHITERLVLSGSHKYPVRDPFSNMKSRSIANQLGSMTNPDSTTFYFATPNKQDYLNLLDVFAESVFNPMLSYSDFMSEGLRMTFSEAGDVSSNLIYKGKVYEDMMGYTSSGEGIFLETLKNSLLKGTSYSFNTGGNPLEISKVSYPDVKLFHSEIYHPSNCSIYSYGSFEAEAIQDYFTQTKTFQKKEFLDMQSTYPQGAPTIQGPIRIHESKPKSLDSLIEGRDAIFGTAFLCNKIGENPLEDIALNILSYLLFETPQSPIYHHILSTGISDGYCPGYGFDSSLKYGYFTIGLKNVEDSKIEEFESQIYAILEDIVVHGFDPTFLESSLHTIEIGSKVQRKDFGLALFESMSGALNLGEAEVVDQVLSVGESIRMIRDKMDQKYFEKLIEKYILKNERRVFLELKTDPKFKNETENLIFQKLKDKKRNMDPEQRKDVVRENAIFKQEMEILQDISILPTLGLEDIPNKSVQQYNVQNTEIFGIKTMLFETKTNKICHIKVKFDLKNLDQSQMVYIYMLELFYNQINPYGYHNNEFQELVSQNMAYLNYDVEYEGATSDPSIMEGNIILSFACLESKLEKSFELISALLTEPNFQDFGQLSTLIRYYTSSSANHIVQNATEYAVGFGGSSFNPASQFFSRLRLNQQFCSIGSQMLNGQNLKQILIQIGGDLSSVMRQIMKKDLITYSVHSESGPIQNKICKKLEILSRNIKSIYRGKISLYQRYFIF